MITTIFSYSRLYLHMATSNGRDDDQFSQIATPQIPVCTSSLHIKSAHQGRPADDLLTFSASASPRGPPLATKVQACRANRCTCPWRAGGLAGWRAGGLAGCQQQFAEAELILALFCSPETT